MTAPVEAAPPLLAMRGVVKRFGGVQALRGVDFDLRRGEIHALLGENGAGKSTLMNILSGVIEPDGGDMRIEGAAVRFADPRAAQARRRRDHLPGARPRAEPRRHGQSLPRPRADPRGRARPAGDAARAPASASPRSGSTSTSTSRSANSRSAAGRSSPSPRR